MERKCSYMFENDHLIVVCVHARTFQATGVTEIIAALSNITSLSIIDIESLIRMLII